MRFPWLKETFGERAALAIERSGDRFDSFIKDEVRKMRNRRDAQNGLLVVILPDDVYDEWVKA